MSSYIDHANKEFDAAGWDIENDEMQKLMCDQVKELLELFGSHGHSGFSASYAINLFTKLAKFEPIVPLSGNDSEWNDISHYGGGTTYQNNRCSHVFKDADGSVYDSNGRVFSEPNGCSYTGSGSRVPVVFPYTPKTEYVKVDFDGEEITDEEWEELRKNYEADKGGCDE